MRGSTVINMWQAKRSVDLTGFMIYKPLICVKIFVSIYPCTTTIISVCQCCKLQVGILARSSREMSLTVRIV